MENNQIRIVVEDGIDIKFRLSDIVSLIYDERGFNAIVELGSQQVRIPVTHKPFIDAAQYIAENVKHCPDCRQRLENIKVDVEGMDLDNYYKCPKCDKSCK